MTDEQIIRGVEVCINTTVTNCSDCPYRKDKNCTNNLTKDFIDLINRKNAEIERLEKLDKLAERSIDASTAVINELRSEIALLNDANTNLQDLYQAEKSKVSKKQEKLIMAYRKLQTAKAEVVKEFAERLKETANSRIYRKDVVYIVEIDNLVKEMVGEVDG